MLNRSICEFVKSSRGSGKRKVFCWDEESLEQYINWAFSRNFLFYVPSENGISGLGVAYPIPNKFNGLVESLLPYDEQLEDESTKDLVVMDWIAKSRTARVELVKQFKRRYTNWESQTKLGIHYGKVKELSNNYLNKLELY